MKKQVLVQKIFISQEEKKIGLMNSLHPLMPSTVALFVNDKGESMDIWMKNTYIDLDILFLDKDKTVKCIKKGKALDETVLRCNGNMKYVIEALSGYVKDMDIQVGDVIEFNLMSGYMCDNNNI